MKNYSLNKVEYYERFRDMIEALGERYGDTPAISWYTKKQEKRGVTYLELREDIRNLQEKLVDMGLAGKHIAIVGENSYEWIITALAANYCGSVAILVDTEQSDDTIVQMLETADTDAVFCSAPYKEICVRYTGTEKPMILFAGKDESVPTVESLTKAGAVIRSEGRENKEIDQQVTPDHTAVIVFTSGTTSTSKAVMLSQSAILTNASDALAYLNIGPRVFTHLPFYHTYGWTCSVLFPLIGGHHLCVNGNMRTLFRDLQLSEAETLFTVPLMLEMVHNKLWLTAEQNGKTESMKGLFNMKKLMSSVGIKRNSKKMEELRKSCLFNVTSVISGGAHLPMEIMEEFQNMGVLVLQGYGITECAPLVSVNRNFANRLNSVGFVIDHNKVKLDNGEILVKGKSLMKGYYKAPELTEEVMKDGWFCTGDLGEFDKDGFLFITGRKKNLIVFKNGKKVSPEKLEEMIKKIPMVQDVMVYGAGNGTSADDVQVAASIYPDKEKTEGMTRYDILEHLRREIAVINNELPLYQQIQMVNIREQEFAKTSLKKIKRHLS